MITDKAAVPSQTEHRFASLQVCRYLVNNHPWNNALNCIGRKVKMAAQFQIMSDLHLEAPVAYVSFEIPVRAPYLALLGDVGDSRGTGLIDFLSLQLKKFEIVFFLLGNHEPYHSSWADVKKRVNVFAKAVTQRKKNGEQLGKFIFLDQTRYDISEYVTVLGCTLHSYILDHQLESVNMGHNDFCNIEDWDVRLHRETHLSDLKWLNEQVRSISQTEPKRKIVILSHHCPVVGDPANNPRYTKSPSNSGFSTDLSAEECWTNPNVKLWAFGHTHFNCDYKDEKTGKQVMTNQKGTHSAGARGLPFKKERVVTI